MQDGHSISRRKTLKAMGAAGALLVLGDTTIAAQAAAPADVVDLAVTRFGKGHS